MAPTVLARTLLALVVCVARGFQTSSLADAESYLQTVGISPGGSMLSVKYEVGSWGERIRVDGASTHLAAAAVANAPTVSWDPDIGLEADPPDSRPNKFVLLAVSPDEPLRTTADGNSAGALGPRIVWWLANCDGSASKCNDLISYEAPTHAANSGTHRLIFILFRQTGGLPSMSLLTPFLSVTTRNNWMLADFIDTMSPYMKPAAINFLYTSAEGPQADADGSGDAVTVYSPQEDGQRSGATALGPTWSAGKPAHDEL